jgi:L-fuculose-phosphate aldolase
MTEDKARAAICEVGKRMYDRQYIAANDGNLSVRIGPDSILCTPTGVAKGFLTPDMLVVVTLTGEVISGSNLPSSEIQMHLRVYQENEVAMGVVHAHPPVATSFAVAGILLDRPILPESVVLLGTVPIAHFATPGTQEQPESIAPYCKDHNAVLLANHGVLTWGEDITEACFRMESLEHSATVLMYSSYIIGKSNELTPDQVQKLSNLTYKF